jgi:hypothetical protein
VLTTSISRVKETGQRKRRRKEISNEVLEVFLIKGNISTFNDPSPLSSPLSFLPFFSSFEMDSDGAFLFLVHRNHGLLLLYTTRKKSKGPHYQVPGGHVDQEDIDTAGMCVASVPRGAVLLNAHQSSYDLSSSY